MSVNYPEPGSIKINDNEILTVESRYVNSYHTGAMGHMYIYLTENIPQESISPQPEPGRREGSVSTGTVFSISKLLLLLLFFSNFILPMEELNCIVYFFFCFSF